MGEALSGVVRIAVLVFAVSSMLSVGLAHTMSQVVGPLRNARGVVRALVGNYIFVPPVSYTHLTLPTTERV